MNWNKNKQCTFITNTTDLLAIKDRLLASDYLAVDTETDSLRNNRITVGLGIAVSEDESYYIPLHLWQDSQLIRPWSDGAWCTLKSTLKEVLTTKCSLITHNGVFDAKAILNTLDFQILDYIKYDTMLMHHTCINESPPHGLKPLAAQYLDPDAALPQDDVKISAINNGGKWNSESKDMYKADYTILGRYCMFDVLYTFGLYNRFKDKLNDPVLKKLWDTEVYPLIKVTYELNTTGIRVDLPYFEQLKIDMTQKVESIEDEIYAQIEDKVRDYELDKLMTSRAITPRSVVGKYLLSRGHTLENLTKELKEDVRYWHMHHKGLKRVFNLDSNDDKAYLLFDVLGCPIKGLTASGKPSTSKAVLDELIEAYSASSGVLQLLRDRSKELKLLNTYVEPILATHEDGRIYPSFNQAGTTSGRYSCGGSSINLQTLPKNDHRIKKGFVPDEGYCFVAADFSSLEARTFATISGEEGIKKIFREGLDFYCSMAIMVLGLKDVSADPNASNYLGTVDKEMRQLAKTFSLALAYGASAGRLAQVMKCDYEDAEEIYDKYMKAFPKLKKWMDITDLKAKRYGYVDSLVGRRKHSPTLHKLYTEYKVTDFSKKSLQRFLGRYKEVDGFTDPVVLYLECRNSLNSSKNHENQSLGASICGGALIDVHARKAPETRLQLMVHDSIILKVKKAAANTEAILLEDCMVNNHVAKMLDVPMEAKPSITDISLAESK